MNRFLIVLLLCGTNGIAQVTIEAAQESLMRRYHIGAYSYLEQFVGHKGYGSNVILTIDGGAAAFGEGDEGIMLYKLDNTGKLQWRREITRKGDEMEPQCVVQDSKGNFYLFSLVYGLSDFRGGCERVVFVNKSGVIGWDRNLGSCLLVNNPIVAYTHTLADGRIAMRGHIVTENPPEDKDPTYKYWEGWIGSNGLLTQQTGDVLDWEDEQWKKLFAPE